MCRTGVVAVGCLGTRSASASKLFVYTRGNIVANAVVSSLKKIHGPGAGSGSGVNTTRFTLLVGPHIPDVRSRWNPRGPGVHLGRLGTAGRGIAQSKKSGARAIL